MNGTGNNNMPYQCTNETDCYEDWESQLNTMAKRVVVRVDDIAKERFYSNGYTPKQVIEDILRGE